MHHNGLINRVFMCRTVVIKHGQRQGTLKNLENVTEPSKNISDLVSIEPDS